MRRRDIIKVIAGSAISWPLAARAQQPLGGMRRIAVMMPYAESDVAAITRVRALQTGLHNFGWLEGRNIQVEYRYAPNADLIKAYATELVRSTPELIVVNSTPATMALYRETRTIPIVMVGVSAPTEEGLVASIARPGGNVTGFTNFDASIGSKWLELLKETAPNLARVGFLYHPQTMSHLGYKRAAESGASSFNVTIEPLAANDTSEIEKTIVAFASNSSGGLIVAPDAGFNNNSELIVRLTSDQHLPAVYAYRFFAKAASCPMALIRSICLGGPLRT